MTLEALPVTGPDRTHDQGGRAAENPGVRRQRGLQCRRTESTLAGYNANLRVRISVPGLALG